jgi:DnaJ-class molecular chaperone
MGNIVLEASARGLFVDLIGDVIEAAKDGLRERFSEAKQRRAKDKEGTKRKKLTRADVLKGAYKLLGLRRNAPIEAVKSAYRARAKNVHPDRGGDEEKFKILEYAYELVTKDIKRRRAKDDSTHEAS